MGFSGQISGREQKLLELEIFLLPGDIATSARHSSTSPLFSLLIAGGLLRVVLRCRLNVAIIDNQCFMEPLLSLSFKVIMHQHRSETRYCCCNISSLGKIEFEFLSSWDTSRSNRQQQDGVGNSRGVL